MQRIFSFPILMLIFCTAAFSFFGCSNQDGCNDEDTFTEKISVDEIKKFETSIQSERYLFTECRCMYPQRHVCHGLSNDIITYKRKNSIFPLYVCYSFDHYNNFPKQIIYNWDGLYRCYYDDTANSSISLTHLSYDDFFEEYTTLKNCLMKKWGTPRIEMTEKSPLFPDLVCKKGFISEWQNNNSDIFLEFKVTNNRMTLKLIVNFFSSQ